MIALGTPASALPQAEAGPATSAASRPWSAISLETFSEPARAGAEDPGAAAISVTTSRSLLNRRHPATGQSSPSHAPKPVIPARAQAPLPAHLPQSATCATV